MIGLKRFLRFLPLVVLLFGCDPGPGDPIKDHLLPVGSTNYVDLGNEWSTFDVKINGVKRTFLYKGRHLGYDSATECITELAPR